MAPNSKDAPQPTALVAKNSSKELFASQLVGELPRCPECSKLLKNRNIKKCDYCGFSYGYLKKLFPSSELPVLETLLDFSNTLKHHEKKNILKAISRIQKRYPQIIPKVCLLPLQQNVAVEQMALWMTNQCPLAENESPQNKEWYIILLIDTTRSKCALAYGYQAEIFIPSESASKLVSLLNRNLKQNNTSIHIIRLLNDLVPILDKAKKMIKKGFKSYKKNLKQAKREK